MHLISYVTFLWILLIMFKLILGQEKKNYHVHTERAVALDGIYLNKYIYIRQDPVKITLKKWTNIFSDF